jgi:hypothetical protein
LLDAVGHALNDVNDIAALCEVVDPWWGFEEGDWVVSATDIT